MKQTTILAAVRPWNTEHRSLKQQISYLKEVYGARIYEIQFDESDLSSEEIRQAIAEGKDVSSYIPEPVLTYIRQHGLYMG